MKDIINDLIAEQSQVDMLVSDLSEEQWITLDRMRSLGYQGCNHSHRVL